MKKFFLGLLIVIILIVGGGFFLISTGKQVDVTWTEQDYQSAMVKSKVSVDDIREINLISLAKKDFTTTGTNEIDATFSESEMSALIAKANDENGPISDFKVSFSDGNAGEISFKLTDYFIDFLKEQKIISGPGSNHAYSSIFLASTSSNNSVTDLIINFITTTAANKPVYASGYLTKTSTNSIDIKIESLKVGQLPMSSDIIRRVETEVVSFVNRVITSDSGFYIEELRIENGQLYYKGTLPKEVNGTRITLNR